MEVEISDTESPSTSSTSSSEETLFWISNYVKWWNTASLTITAIGGRWSVLDGGHYPISGDWSFIFGEIRNLGQNGPGSLVSCLLVASTSSTSSSEETLFWISNYVKWWNTASLTITAIGGRWSVLDGGHYPISGDWSFIFGEIRNLGQNGPGVLLVVYLLAFLWFCMFFWCWFFCISGLRSWMADYVGKFTYASDCNQAATTCNNCQLPVVSFGCGLLFHIVLLCFWGSGAECPLQALSMLSGQWGSILIWSSCHLPETLAIFVSYLAFGSYCFNVRSASEIVDEKRKFLEKNFRVQQQLGSKVRWLLTLIKSWLQHHVRPAWLLPICRHASDHLPPWHNNEGTSLSENGQVLRLSAAPSQA